MYTIGLCSKKIGPRMGILDSTGTTNTGNVPELFKRSMFDSRYRDEMNEVMPVPKMLIATPLTI